MMPVTFYSMMREGKTALAGTNEQKLGPVKSVKEIRKF
jgi:hypothetical protein